jgi:hypothetical protein
MEKLPKELKFRGLHTVGPPAVATGHLHLLHVAVRFLLCRPFFGISYDMETSGLSYSITPAQASQLEEMAIEAIDWANRHKAYIGGWFVVIYALFICSTIVVRFL